ncbi:hypothetical protein PTD2_19390 [Pseudoalteromonas tunicata D2]|uniref:Uncharacterized protein n=1 Tax=Pseudoalteromonas tunicata D2 TaxID=87626 RepID=A4CCD1_9GAMM|nr:hypothetical protein PTD2_19390 [Pseudoalteromonas tunicata D2]
METKDKANIFFIIITFLKKLALVYELQLNQTSFCGKVARFLD